MQPSARDLAIAAVEAISPLDATEHRDRTETLAWMRGGAEIYRRRSPDVPPRHLVAYFALVDVEADAILLVDHRNAQLWLPTGGHVEPDEDPRVTVTRELAEELGIAAPLVTGLTSNPLLVTQTLTQGLDGGHVDVSLWYVVAGDVDDDLTPDPGEFRDCRWWPRAEVLSAPPAILDPYLPRFVAKLWRDLRA